MIGASFVVECSAWHPHSLPQTDFQDLATKAVIMHSKPYNALGLLGSADTVSFAPSESATLFDFRSVVVFAGRGAKGNESGDFFQNLPLTSHTDVVKKSLPESICAVNLVLSIGKAPHALLLRNFLLLDEGLKEKRMETAA